MESLNLYRVLYLNVDSGRFKTSWQIIEPIQSVVFKYRECEPRVDFLEH